MENDLSSARMKSYLYDKLLKNVMWFFDMKLTKLLSLNTNYENSIQNDFHKHLRQKNGFC